MSRQYYNDIFQMIEDIFSDVANTDFWSLQPSRFNKSISSADYPPANVTVDQKTKKLIIEVALAGCEEKDISLSFDSDYLRLVVDRSIEKKEPETNYVIQRGLRVVDKAEVSWLVDPRYYDRDNVDVSFNNGLLTIIVSPRAEVAPKKINLFGKLEKPAITEKTE